MQVLTCLVGKRLCAGPHEDHWQLRQRAAGLLSSILKRFRDKYTDLQPRVTKTLLDALQDKGKPIPTHYGALLGLAVRGPLVSNAHPPCVHTRRDAHAHPRMGVVAYGHGTCAGARAAARAACTATPLHARTHAPS